MNEDREHSPWASDCESGARNRFYRGKAMKAEEFEAEQSYFIRRRRLANRSLAGWGVVYGFAMDGVRPPEPPAPGDPEPERTRPGIAKIGPGFALDRHGREILLVDRAPVELDRSNTFLLEPHNGGWRAVTIAELAEESKMADSGATASGPLHPLRPGKYLLQVHYAERSFGDANLPADCGCERPEKRFVCETIAFSLTALGDKKCPCKEKACPHCGCRPHGPCDQASRGPHSCLCQWTRDASAGQALDVSLPAHWHGLKLDPSDGVALACVEAGLTDDRCHPIGIVIEDDCGPRRLVKNNDLLYDLLRGCDLTRIESISWGKYHRSQEKMPWDFFERRLLETPGKEASYELTPDYSGPLGLRIRFTGPVQSDTVTLDCFEMRFIIRSPDTGWYEMRIVRIIEVDKRPWRENKDYTREVFLHLDRNWRSEVTKGPNVLERPTLVQIDVYGDFILDCNGQALDANSRGFGLRDDYPKVGGNGSPGGTFRSVFRLDKHPRPEGHEE